MGLVVIGTIVLILGFCYLGASLAAQKSRNRRMIKGTPVRIESQPYVVSLQNEDGTHTCVGTIVNERVILTAAHCLLDRPMQVKAGSSYIDSGGTIHKVTRQLPHEQYSHNLTDLRHDIGLVSLEPPIILNNVTTEKVKLFNVNETVKRDAKAMALGWGSTKETSEGDFSRTSLWDNIKSVFVKYPMDHYYSNQLRRIDFSITSNMICQRTFNCSMVNTICALLQDRSICKGDSGGPLMVQGRQGGIISLCGSLSEKGKCSVPGLPIAFTDVGAYRDWIDRNVEVVMQPLPKKTGWTERFFGSLKKLYCNVACG